MASTAASAWRTLAAFDDLSESWSTHQQQKDGKDGLMPKSYEAERSVRKRAGSLPSQSSSSIVLQPEAHPASDPESSQVACMTPSNGSLFHLTERPEGQVDFADFKSRTEKIGYSRWQAIETSTPPPPVRPHAAVTQAKTVANSSDLSSSSSQVKQGHRMEADCHHDPCAEVVASTVQSVLDGLNESHHDEATVLHHSDVSSLPPMLRPAWQDGSPAKERLKAIHGGKLPKGVISAGKTNLFSPSKLQTMFRTPTPTPTRPNMTNDIQESSERIEPQGSSASEFMQDSLAGRGAVPTAARFGFPSGADQKLLGRIPVLPMDSAGPKIALEAEIYSDPVELQMREQKRIRLDTRGRGPQLSSFPSPFKPPSKSPERNYKGDAARLLRDVKRNLFGVEASMTNTNESTPSPGTPLANAKGCDRLQLEHLSDEESPRRLLRRFTVARAREAAKSKNEAGTKGASPKRAEEPQCDFAKEVQSSAENQRLMQAHLQQFQSSHRLRRSSSNKAMFTIKASEIPAENLRALAGNRMSYDAVTMTWQKRRSAVQAGSEADVSDSTDAFANLDISLPSPAHRHVGPLPRSRSVLRNEIEWSGSITVSGGSRASGRRPVEASSPRATMQNLLPTDGNVLAFENPSPTRSEGLRSILKGQPGALLTPRRRILEVGNASVSFVEPAHEQQIAGALASLAELHLMRSKGPKSAVRSHREDTSAWLDATILTEMSFAIAQDRVLQVLTDVVPWQPDWENLSVLDLSNRRVETLMKLQDFCPNLLDVNLNDNLIVYLSGLPSSIRHLQVARNRLSSLVSFARLRNLQTLDISENAVESIDNLCCLDSLKHLRADSTQIDSINGIDSIATLESISLQHNNLKTIDLQGTTWTELRHLSLSHNQLESLTGLTHLAHLYTLQVEHNNLSQLDCRGGLRKLRLLRVSGNPRLSILNIKDLAKLRTLYADFCHLDEIQHLPHAKRLENLSLRAQQNSDFRWPRHLPSSIQRMFLSGNPLQNSLPGEDAGELTNLVYLELAACQLEQLPDHMWSLMPNLRHLNLDHNLFVELPNLRALHRLKRLSAVSCRLEKTAPIIRALQDLPLESLDTRMNACTHGLYAPIIAPSRYVEPRTPNSDNLPKGFASVAPPFPNPAVVQPAFSQKELSLGKQAEDPSAAHKSFFHKRLPTPIRGASNSEQGVSQTAMTLAADARFIRALPEAARQQRTLHRGVLAMACAQLTHIDGLPVSDAEIEEASRLLE